MPVEWLRIAATAVVVAFIPAPISVAAQEPAERTVMLSLVAGKATGAELQAGPGAPVLRAYKGERLALRWTSDRPARLHLHGYDVEVAVAADNAATMRIEARATGRFPIETHGVRHATVLYLEVLPRP
jgi:hypothetical protein